MINAYHSILNNNTFTIGIVSFPMHICSIHCILYIVHCIVYIVHVNYNRNKNTKLLVIYNWTRMHSCNCRDELWIVEFIIHEIVIIHDYVMLCNNKIEIGKRVCL